MIAATSSETILPYVITGIAGIAFMALHAFCKHQHVQVNEIGEFLATQQQYIVLLYLFKTCLLVITISFLQGARGIVWGGGKKLVLRALQKKHK
jgi:hypothetical protein